MNCTEIRPLLSSYIDGEATPEERARVERHLLRCQDCPQALAEYRAIGSDMRALALPVPPASLRRDVWKAIEARESGRRVFGNPASSASKSQPVTLPRAQSRSGLDAIFTSLGNGWAKALPAALLVGGLLLVMAVLMLRGTIATAAAELVEREPLGDYGKPVHVKFNERVIGEDAEKYTYVRRMEGTMPFTETVIAKYESTGSNSGNLELRPQTAWVPGATYEVYVACQRIGTGVADEVMRSDPLTFTFSAAAHTPTPTNTSTSTPTPTNTPVPPSSTPEPTAIAQESPPAAKSPGVPPRTQTRAVGTAAAASPTALKGSGTVPVKPTSSVIAGTPTITPSISAPTKIVTTVTLTLTPAATSTARPPQTATVTPTASTATVTATSIRKTTVTVTSTVTPRVSVTATPPCSLMPVHGFGQVWNSESSVRGRVGCPAAPEDAVAPTAYQRFQGGFMFWRGDTRTIYVFRGGSTDTYGTWWQFHDTWQEGDPLPSKTPPAKLYAPVRGFGKVWYNNESVQLALGWALEPESNTGAVWQQYEKGNALWTADRTIRFMYSDGLYARFDDTFVPEPGE